MTFTPTFLLIATAKYNQYVTQCTESIKKYFPNAIIYLFSDREGQFKIKHEPFPYVTLYRFHYFLKAEKHIVGDYLYFMDIDSRFVDYPEIKGDLVGVRHCGFYFKDLFPQEKNINSVFANYKFRKYYGGGFFGGNREEFWKLCRWCESGITTDVGHDIIPVHNDETAMNAYFSIHPPTLELTPEYHYPEECQSDKPEWQADKNHFINNCWNGGNPFSPKILLLKKNHEEVRSESNP